jgi:hypothetical protein
MVVAVGSLHLLLLLLLVDGGTSAAVSGGDKPELHNSEDGTIVAAVHVGETSQLAWLPVSNYVQLLKYAATAAIRYPSWPLIEASSLRPQHHLNTRLVQAIIPRPGLAGVPVVDQVLQEGRPFWMFWYPVHPQIQINQRRHVLRHYYQLQHQQYLNRK